MPTLTKEPNEVFRDYVTEGVPASGAHAPVKSEVRTLLNEMVDGFDPQTVTIPSGTTALAPYENTSGLDGLQILGNVAATMYIKVDPSNWAAGESIHIKNATQTQVINVSAGSAGSEVEPFESFTGSGATAFDLGPREAVTLRRYTGAGSIPIWRIFAERRRSAPSKTVAELATFTPTAGALAFCSDEVGGAVLVFGDGANWRRVTDRAIAS